MSNENDRPGNTWDDEHEGEFPRTFGDSYLNAANSYRPRPRPGNTSQGDVPRTPRQPGNRARPRGSSPGGGRIYEERDDRPSQRPRPARQSREEVYARLRQRPRRPIYARDQEELPPRQSPPARNQGQLVPRREPLDDYPYQQPDPPRVAQSARRTTSMYPDRSAYERGARGTTTMMSTTTMKEFESPRAGKHRDTSTGHAAAEAPSQPFSPAAWAG